MSYNDRFNRSRMIVGNIGIFELRMKKVAVFGLGGVGGAAVEALARSGVGSIDLIDGDVFTESNLNRQILSTDEVIGKSKVDVAFERIRSIDRMIKVNRYNLFYLPEKRNEIPFDTYDYVIDAIDTVKAKVDIALACKEKNIPLISALGCGNRLDPTQIKVTDIRETFNDPFAKVMRKALKEAGIENYKVVFSLEPPIKPESEEAIEEELASKRHTPGSFYFVPNAAGLLLAYEVVSSFLPKKRR